MISLLSLEYELKESPAQVMSRINWAVEEVEVDHWQDYSNFGLARSSQRDWIGQIDQKAYWFSIQEPDSFFKKKFIVVAEGKLHFKASTTKISVKLGLNIFTFIVMLFIYATTASSIVRVLLESTPNEYGSIIFPLLLSLISTILIVHRLKTAERKLDFLFAEGQ